MLTRHGSNTSAAKARRRPRITWLAINKATVANTFLSNSRASSSCIVGLIKTHKAIFVCFNQTIGCICQIQPNNWSPGGQSNLLLEATKNLVRAIKFQAYNDHSSLVTHLQCNPHLNIFNIQGPIQQQMNCLTNDSYPQCGSNIYSLSDEQYFYNQTVTNDKTTSRRNNRPTRRVAHRKFKHLICNL
jgi:hypothetical protein